MRDILGVKSFQQELISKGLKIICKVSGGIYSPGGYGGGGVCHFGVVRTGHMPDRGTGVMDQGSEKLALPTASIVRAGREIICKRFYYPSLCDPGCPKARHPGHPSLVVALTFPGARATRQGRGFAKIVPRGTF